MFIALNIIWFTRRVDALDDSVRATLNVDSGDWPAKSQIWDFYFYFIGTLLFLVALNNTHSAVG